MDDESELEKENRSLERDQLKQKIQELERQLMEKNSEIEKFMKDDKKFETSHSVSIL